MERTYVNTKYRTLKDGTVREYKYEMKYTTKTDMIQNAGKTELKRRIDKCKDKQIIDAISDLLAESGY